MFIFWSFLKQRRDCFSRVHALLDLLKRLFSFCNRILEEKKRKLFSILKKTHLIYQNGSKWWYRRRCLCYLFFGTFVGQTLVPISLHHFGIDSRRHLRHAVPRSVAVSSSRRSVSGVWSSASKITSDLVQQGNIFFLLDHKQHNYLVLIKRMSNCY